MLYDFIYSVTIFTCSEHVHLHLVVAVVFFRTKGSGGDYWAVWNTVSGREADGAGWRSGEGDQEASRSQPGHSVGSAHQQGQARDLHGSPTEAKE